jgi:hypothetical protein
MRRGLPAGFLAICVLGLAACGKVATTPGGATSPTASAAATPARTLLVTYSSAAASTPPVVWFFNLAGEQVGQVTLATNSYVAGVAGSRVFVMTQSGSLSAIHPDGSSEALGELGTTAPFTPSPDGKRWVWATSETQGNLTASAIHLGGDGIQPRVIETATEPYRALQPYEWTATGLFVERGAMGIGGYIPYLPATGPVDEVDVKNNSVKPVAGSEKCAFSDMAADGTVACFPQTPHTLRLQYADGRTNDIGLATPRFNFSGDAYFDANGQQLTVGGATGQGAEVANGEQYATDLVKTGDASISRLSLGGVRPVEFNRAGCWLPDGSLLVYRPSGSADGVPETFIYHSAGTTTTIATPGMPLGFVSG